MENSIEEDIKIIEDFILKTDVDYSEYNEQIVGDISYQAIQHLLSTYQEVLKENEQLSTEVNSLKKENEEKDKTIQNMSKYIISLDIDKDICMKNTTNTELCNEDNSNCIECIKKHFSN